MSAVLAGFDGSAIHTVTRDWGAIAVAGKKLDVDVFEDDATLSAVWGKARFADAALARLAADQGAARALAVGYASTGDAMLKTMRGHFGVALLDRAAGKALLATDRMGTHPLCYVENSGMFVFASNLDAISLFPGVAMEIDRQGIYDYLHFHMVPGPRTIYLGRKRLQPGEAVEWTPSRIRSWEHWRMEFVEDGAKGFDELRAEFLTTLRQSVAKHADEEDTGAFLSGGTDSSTLAGMMREVRGKAPRTYSIGFDAEGFDEMEYARLAARHFRTEHHEYYVTPADVVTAIPLIAAVHDQPFGNSSAVPAYYCAKLARADGITTMLGGDGGDELFGGNSRYATQYLYSLYSDLPAGLRKGTIEPALSILPSLGLIGKVQRYVATASLPMPTRYDNYNLLERLGPHNVFTDEFLAAVDPASPVRQVAEWHGRAGDVSLINQMLAVDRKYTLTDNDLPKVSRSCELAAVQAAYPMLSDELVDFSLQLRPFAKLKGTRLRYFFKKALAGFLPDEVIRKSKHGFGLPFGRWLVDYAPLRRLAMDSLAELKKRGIVRAQMLEDLTSTRVSQHADYFGTMVWVLMMLEQWLRHRPGFQTWRNL